MNFMDRAIAWISPERGLKRAQYRKAFEATAYYEGAGQTYRSKNFRRNQTDANSAFRGQLSDLAAISRDMVRNNAYAARGIEAIVNNTVGTGIVAKIVGRNATDTKKLQDLWKVFSETDQCDADGVDNIYGLQRLVMRCIAESGEVLIRRRARLLRDGFALPFRMQVLEPDYIDSNRDGPSDIAGNVIIQGIEFNNVGRRVGYWLFDRHPGNSTTGIATSSRVNVDNIIHVYRRDRPGQVRGVPWLAPAVVRLQNLAGFEDAQLMRQKIAACFAVFVENSDLPGTQDGEPNLDMALTETVRPGTIQHVPPGKKITFTDPPAVGEYGVVTEQNLRAVAVSLGITYECLTGNLSQVNYSSGRMGWLEMYRNLEAWRWLMLLPRFCDKFAQWFLDGALIATGAGLGATIEWTPPRREMIDPSSEIPALVKGIRAGLITRSSVIREYGYDPITVYDELKADNDMADERELILDSDPRKVTQVGQEQMQSQGGEADAGAQQTNS